MRTRQRDITVRRASAIIWLLCAIIAAIVARPYALACIDSAFLAAVRAGNPQQVERMLKLGADPNGYRNGEPLPMQLRPLSEAVRRGHISVARVLIKHRADVNAHPFLEPPALIIAAQAENVEGVRLLLESGAAADTPDADADTALIVGAANPEIVELLIGKGAAVNAANTLGQTALLRAAGALSEESVRILLRHGAKPNMRTARGLTPLQRAIRSSPGADPNLNPFAVGLRRGSSRGWFETPASRRKRLASTLAIARLLLDAGAEVNTHGIDGFSPLMDSVSHPSSVAALLLEHGADPSYRSADKQTAVTIALATHRQDVARMLQARGARP